MLTHQACQKAPHQGKRYQLSDGEGLFLNVSPKGKKTWQLRYRTSGQQKFHSIGRFPEIGLADARKIRSQVVEAIATGGDVSEALNLRSVGNFEAVAKQWYALRANDWDRKYAHIVWRRMELYVLPVIGSKAFPDITPTEILGIVKSIEARGFAETSRRVKDYISKIFDFAKFEGLIAANPVDGINVRLAPVPKTKHMPFIHPKDMPQFFARFQSYEGERQTRILMEIVIRTFVRTKEIRKGKWPEIKGDIWTIPGERMKMGRDHIVPLPPQVVDLFEQLRDVGQDPTQWLINRGTKLRPQGDQMCAISENCMLSALYYLGYKHKATIHGFRRTASTYLNECGKYRPDVIEMQLAHVERNKVRGAYNAAEYLDERRTMMLHWNKVVDQWKTTGALLA